MLDTYYVCSGLFLVSGCVTNSLHVRLSHSLCRELMLSVINAVVSQPCLCHHATEEASFHLASIEAHYDQTGSLQDHASLNQQAAD